MDYAISHGKAEYQYQSTVKRKSVIIRFFQWAAGQDEVNHIGWVGATVTIMAAIFFPLTMAVILLNGALFGFIIAAMAALALVVITNLAALPTKYTIPFFFLGILADVVIMIVSFFIR